MDGTCTSSTHASSKSAYADQRIRVTLDLPRRRLGGCSCRSPLAHFYLHHGDSSLRELHPFTTITHLASQSKATPSDDAALSISFLFQKQGTHATVESSNAIDISPSEDRRAASLQVGCPITPARMRALLKNSFKSKENHTTHIQWTIKLANLVSDERREDSTPPRDASTIANESGSSYVSKEADLMSANTRIRLEGPYFTPSDPAQYSSVLCLVAGTGISGALAIAAAFAAQAHTRDHDGGADNDSRRQSVAAGWSASLLTPNTDPSTPRAPTSTTTISPAPPTSQAPPPPNHPWTTTHIIWSVRSASHIPLTLPSASGLTLLPHLTGPGGNGTRLDISAAVRNARDAAWDGKIWVYISGPGAFIAAAEAACKALKVDYYGARWDI